jgi:hypothetical protein
MERCDMAAVPDDVVRLVKQFGAGEKRYTQKGYQELEARSEFIDPLFEALGWDVRNVKGALPDQREVFLENTIKRGDVIGEGIENIVGRRPDYAFRMDGQRKFYVEAKKPAEALATNSAHAFQVRAYGWSAKLPISILTDFQELSVYDCRVKPEEADQAATALLPKGYFTYDQYIERWDEIEGLLSREAVEAGALERFAEEKPPRGALTVDASFLRDMSVWREVLARDIAGRNGGLSQQELNYAVQMTINRIIFLRICEDRGIEPQGRLQETIATRRGGDVREGAVYRDIVRMFKRADERYNSGLFHFVDEKQRSEHADHFTLKLEVGDEAMTEVIRHLYYPFPYKFDVIPIEILGQVYEQFLGKVIVREADGGVKIEDKPEVRKAGGVYYTPTYIVDYIVENTVGKLLEGTTPVEVSLVRILDPACGSGSFLIGAYGYLLDWHLRWYTEHEPEKWVGTRRKDGPLQKVKVRVGKDGKEEQGYRLTVEERKRILLNDIYGVDIDTQAVEVTKLSLLLKVLEGEIEGPTQLGLREFGEQERVLPDLGANIKCGNSLIGPDFYTSGQASFLDEEEERRINVFDWESGFPEIMKVGGFDAVIGNPPYGADATDLEKGYFQSRFNYKKGKPETYIYFLEQGTNLLTQGGVLGYITPNAWLTNYYGVQLRRFLFERTSIMNLVDLEPTKVFQQAVVDTALTILIKDREVSNSLPTLVSRGTRQYQIIPQFKVYQANWEADPEAVINLQADLEDVRLLSHLEESTFTLGALVEYSQGVIPYKTKADGEANLYISQTNKGEGWLPLLENASQVRRYETDPPKAFINYGRWLWCARESRFFSQPKLLFHRVRKKLPRQLVASFDSTGAINRHSLSNFIAAPDATTADLLAVLGLFNSTIANWWFVKRYGLLMEVGGFKLMRLPLPTGWTKGRDRMVRLVEGMLELHRRLGEAKTPHEKEGIERRIEATDGEIDRLVYELYGLTEEEIRVVEGRG